jgi:peptide/nickel transport system permease protein
MLVRFSEDPLGNLQMFIVPVIVLGMGMAGANMRYGRTMMLEVLRQDYIRTAWSKGLKESLVVLRHALKNALIPIVTIWGMQVPFLLGGTVIIEQIFGLPGIGRLLVDAIASRDEVLISGIVLIMAVVVMLTNLVVDLIYAYLDPRIHYE